MLDNVEVLCHNSIRFSNKKIIYVDPFKIDTDYKDADIILITHSHYDHFSEEDILKVKKDNTKIVITDDLYNRTIELGFQKQDIIVNYQNESTNINDIFIETIPAYNTNKKFHPKENNWVGYLIKINDITYYIAGDTDITEENLKVKCDVAFIPIGGTYTMDYIEAARFVNEIKPKIVVPVHYGTIVGEKEYAQRFKNMINSNIKCEILIK